MFTIEENIEHNMPLLTILDKIFTNYLIFFGLLWCPNHSFNHIKKSLTLNPNAKSKLTYYLHQRAFSQPAFVGFFLELNEYFYQFSRLHDVYLSQS